MDVLNITALNYVSYLTLEIFQGGGYTRDPPQKWKPDVVRVPEVKHQAASSVRDTKKKRCYTDV